MRKFFIFGKVYDLDTQSIPEISGDITNRMRDFTGIDSISAYIELTSPSSVLIGIERNLDRSYIQEGSILEQDKWLITGEGYQKFKPQYCMAPPFPHFPNVNYCFDMNDFIKEYKKEAVYWGATKIQEAKISEGTQEMLLRVSFSR